MMKIKKVLLIASIITLSATFLSGCKKNNEEEEEVINYELKAYTEDELQAENYYIKTEKGYYPVAPGIRSYDEKELLAKQVSNDRMVWFGPDDVQIPTLYKNQELVLYTNQQIPTEFVFERYEDLGYTLGVRMFTENTGGRIEASLDYATIHPLSSAYEELKSLDPGTILGINKIGTTTLSSEYLSRGGTIKGLQQNQTYSCDLYIGSNYYNSQLVADTHAFASFELYNTTEYEYNQANYITVKIPDYFYSGYYYINGCGLFKYVANSSSEGITGDNFNAPYYVGIDDDGNLLNREEFELYMKNKDSEVIDKPDENENEPTWNSVLKIDRTMDVLDVLIYYKDIDKVVNIVDEQTSAQLVQAEQIDKKEEEEKAAPPEISLMDPSGDTHLFVEDTSRKEKDDLYTYYSCSVQMPESGEWIIKLKGMEQRVFSIETNIGSGESNSVVHSGTGAAELNYYLKNALRNAVFSFTWENTEHACTIEITGPDGEKIKEEDMEVLSTGYGATKLRLGTLIAGEYRIRINGEDLGRIRCESYEYDGIENQNKTNDESKEDSNDESTEDSNDETSKDSEKTQEELEKIAKG